MTTAPRRRPTPVWTDTLSAAAAGVGAASAAGVLAGTFGLPTALLLWAGLLGTAVVALVAGPWAGSVAGVLASWGSLELLRRTDEWGTTEFWAVGALVAALVATGAAFGRLRVLATAAPAGNATSESPLVPDSVGILTRRAGELRLDEELARARSTFRPLTVARLRIRSLDPDTAPGERRAAERAVVRLVDSRLRVVDVPYAESDVDLVVIMPEAREIDALRLVGGVLSAMTSTTYAVRATDERRTVADDVEVLVGIASWADGMTGARALLDAAAPEIPA